MEELSQKLQLSKLQLILESAGRGALELRTVLVIDQSSRIKAHTFRALQLCASSLADTLLQQSISQSYQQYYMGVLKYDNQCVDIVTEFTQDAAKLKKAVQEMQCSHAGAEASTENALGAALKMLRAAKGINRSVQKGLIVLFTQSSLANSQTHFKLFSHPESDTRLLILHISKAHQQPEIHQSALEEAQLINFASAEAMLRVLQKLANMRPPELRDLLCSGEILELVFELSDIRITHYEVQIISNTLGLPVVHQQQYFTADSPSIIIRGLPAQTVLYLRYRAILDDFIATRWSNEALPHRQRQGTARWIEVCLCEHLPRTVREKLHLSAEALERENLSLHYDLAHKTILLRLKQLGVHKLNVLLMGLCGSGKSSLANTFDSVFQRRYSALQPTGRSTRTVTTRIGRISLTNDDSFSCLDSFGIDFSSSEKNLSNSNYAHCLPSLLNGFIQPGFELRHKQHLAESEYYVKNADFVAPGDRVHAVLFAVDMTMCHDPAYCRPIADFLSYLVIEAHMQPLVVLTKADEILAQQNAVGGKVCLQQMLLERYQRLQGLINIFWNNIGRKVDRVDIFVFSSYTAKYESADACIEQLALHLLERVYNRALDFVETLTLEYVALEIEGQRGFAGKVQLQHTLCAVSEIRQEVDEQLRTRKILLGKSEWIFLNSVGDEIERDQEQVQRLEDCLQKREGERGRVLYLRLRAQPEKIQQQRFDPVPFVIAEEFEMSSQKFDDQAAAAAAGVAPELVKLNCILQNVKGECQVKILETFAKASKLCDVKNQLLKEFRKSEFTDGRNFKFFDNINQIYFQVEDRYSVEQIIGESNTLILREYNGEFKKVSVLYTTENEVFHEFLDENQSVQEVRKLLKLSENARFLKFQQEEQIVIGKNSESDIKLKDVLSLESDRYVLRIN